MGKEKTEGSEDRRKSMKRKILFILGPEKERKGVVQLMRELGLVYSIQPAAGAKGAIEAITHTHFDLVISPLNTGDARGTDLVATLRRRIPLLPTILYGDPLSRSELSNAQESSHLYISRPFDVVKILRDIQRIFRIGDIVENERLREAIATVKKLPSLPDLFLQLKEETHKENCSVRTITDIVARDSAITAQIMKFANSAMLGSRSRINSLGHAISYIGVEILKSLVLKEKLFASATGTVKAPFPMKEYSCHSGLCGKLSYIISMEESGERKVAEEALLAGVLHDIGKLVLLEIPDFYKTRSNVMRDAGISSLDAEYRILGVSHAEAGAYLLSLWGFSDTVVESAAYHHRFVNISSTGFSVPLAIHIADSLILENLVEKNDYHPESFFNQELLLMFEMKSGADRWQELFEKTHFTESG